MKKILINKIIEKQQTFMNPINPIAKEAFSYEEIALAKERAYKKTHSILFRPTLDQIEGKGDYPLYKSKVLRMAMEGDKGIHVSGKEPIDQLKNILIDQKSPQNVIDIKICSDKLEELNLDKYNDSNFVTLNRLAHTTKLNENVEGAGTKEIADLIKVENLTKRVKEMDQFYELDLEMVQNLANQIAIDLGPETLQVLVDYLKVTIGIVKPSISSAVVIIYFSMKTGPGTMLNMYYTLTYETQMKGFLTKVINNIEKQYTPIYKMATNYKIAANININDLQNLKFKDNLTYSDLFNKYKKEIAMTGSGVAAVTFTICGIKYFMLSPEIMEDKDLALQWIATLKDHGATYAYALSDAVGTIFGSARSGAIDGFLQGIIPEVKKVGTALGELVSSFEKARNK